MHTLKHTTRLSSQARSVGAGTVSTPQAASLRNHGAFTLIEMLVVISIVVLVVGFTIPALSLMQSTSRSEAGYNTVSVAVEAARQLATQETPKQDPISSSPNAGTAVLVTNTGTIRLLQNNPNRNPSKSQNAYVDMVGRNYISIPNSVGIAGMVRYPGGTKLFAPPFALRFNSNGHLVYGARNTAKDRLVYYDGDYDNPPNYETSDERPTGYNPADNRKYDPDEGKWIVPFEEIETVVGVMVFDAGEVSDLSAESSSDRYINEDASDRIFEIGRPIFFSRYTGAPLR